MITDYTDLFAMRGQTVYIVLSPFSSYRESRNPMSWVGMMGNEGKEPKQGVANTDVHEWVVGDVFKINDRSIVLSDGGYKFISLKDMGVIKNDYNNHAIFSTQKEVDDYVAYMKAAYKFDQEIEDMFKKSSHDWTGRYDFYLTTLDLNRSLVNLTDDEIINTLH